MKKKGKRLTAGFLAVLLLLTVLPIQDVQAASQSDGIPVQQVSAGEAHTAVVKADGSMWIWGSNGYGQLGTGDKNRRLSPVKILDHVARVSLGEGNSSAALKEDGSLWMWGFNYYGQLGTGDKTDRLKPVKILTNVKSVTLGLSCGSAAITKDGSLYTWGKNSYGRLGTGDEKDITTPKKVMSNVASVALGQNHAAAIKTDGSLWTWGYNYCGQLGNGDSKTQKSYAPVKILDNVKSVSLSKDYSAAIKKDGSLWTWGNNIQGRLGIGVAEEGQAAKHFSPLKIMDNVKIVSPGENGCAAVQNDGTLWTWGNNERGQLGTGDEVKRLKPVKILSGVTDVSMARLHGGAVKTDGSLWMWGTNSHCALGIGKETGLTVYSVPVQIPVPGKADASQKPGKPQVTSVTNVAAGITVKWGKVSNATGYYIYRKTGNGKWKQIAKVSGAGTLSYKDASVKSKNGTAYTYSVCAYNSTATGDYNKTGKTILRLTAPTFSSAVNKATRKAKVSWKRNAKAAGYQIQYGASSKFTGAKKIKVTPGKATSKTLTKLAKGKTYYIRIRCYKKSGGVTSYSAWSSSKKVKIKK
ncbi:MAG: hypothetical protein HFH60_08825 [Lachnospiraceae bacterium]|nr:hypothetical protein [Lachnospiraceae bacterium]